jgi:L-lactate dehydrogenase complex protein LldG
MSNHSRKQIFDRLHAAQKHAAAEVPESVCLPVETYDKTTKVEQLKALMQAVRSEVHVVRRHDWVEKLKAILKQKEVKTLLYAPETDIGKTLENARREESNSLPELIAYQQEIENCKDDIFKIDAGITSTLGAVAETGAIIVWPTEKEPRLMSLVPPIHIAVLDADTIFNTFCEAIQTQNWPEKMPSNVLLISGPSKTADIELVLAFGVHGPKELVVLIVED